MELAVLGPVEVRRDGAAIAGMRRTAGAQLARRGLDRPRIPWPELA